MNKFKIITIVFLLMIILSACSISEPSINERLKAPKNTTTPLEGKWNVTDYIPISGTNSKEEKEYMGQPALFHKEGLIFMNYYTVKPSFKMKKVNAVDYFLYKYKISANKLGIDSKNVEVFSIYNDNQFFMEVVKDNKGNLFLYMEDGFYKLEKMIDKVSIEEIKKYIDIEEKMTENLKDKKTENQNSGILLGIKTSKFDEKNNAPDWSYSTIWINTKDKEVEEIYKIDELLLPRKNGFWEIDVNRTIEKDYISDEINANPQIYIKDDKKISSSFIENEVTRSEELNLQEKSILKNILYVGKNYISTESIDMANKNKRTMKMQTVDNLKNNNSINLGDIIEGGKEIFLEGAQSLLNIDETVLLDEGNIGLTRKNGYWMLKGRVNYEKNEEELNKDFIIKAVPPEEMIGYDMHFILWDELKRKFPNMIDMYSSPNEDIVIIRNQFELLVYSNDLLEDINSHPLARIEIPESDSIVMAEWSTQKYTEIWRNEILKRDAKKIEW
ncbi:hypothetical protein [Tissierella creatinophila]|uniref:Lipoprotein n=1 Tax=Tissierella creatinophila DSM 6911 TaxID=1123403 RepID=A0A1U7M5H6_TISCR|nr:hypothetical protein [Tissierella creatinophila]OLS02541.1 hypothetical protein TICRE_14970 [Tissierella creatinophila DSM 6911]